MRLYIYLIIKNKTHTQAVRARAFQMTPIAGSTPMKVAYIVYRNISLTEDYQMAAQTLPRNTR